MSTAKKVAAVRPPTDKELYDVACDFDECKTYQDILGFGREVLSRWGSAATQAGSTSSTPEGEGDRS